MVLLWYDWQSWDDDDDDGDDAIFVLCLHLRHQKLRNKFQIQWKCVCVQFKMMILHENIEKTIVNDIVLRTFRMK